MVDARGMPCPGPLAELARALKSMKPGQVASLYSDDESSKTDVPRWVEKAGHKLLGVVDHGDYTEFIVEKAHA